jgi:hypothetical protein
MISEPKCWFIFDLHQNAFGERLFGLDVMRVFYIIVIHGMKFVRMLEAITFGNSTVDKRTTFHVVLLQHLTRILPETVTCSSHPIIHTARHCWMPQTISNLKTRRPWLLFTGPVNIHDEFIPRITTRDCCNVILFEASTSVCFWTHESCSKCKLLSSHSLIRVKVKVKINLEQATKGQRGRTFPLTSALDGVGGQRYAPAALPPGQSRYPLYRRLGGSQGWSGQVRKISLPPVFDPRTVQPVGSRYTDWAILATLILAANSSKIVAPLYPTSQHHFPWHLNFNACV